MWSIKVGAPLTSFYRTFMFKSVSTPWMCLCIKILPQTQNKFSFPQSQNKLNTIILRKKEKIIKKEKEKKENELDQIKSSWFK